MMRMIGEELNVNPQSVHDILTKGQGSWKVCKILVPKNVAHLNKLLAKILFQLLHFLELNPFCYQFWQTIKA